VRRHAWGLQFHAEVTLPMVRAWLEEGADGLPVAADDFLAATEERIAGWNDLGRKLCSAFLEMATSR
jgi:hypothetical protein